MTWSYTVSFPYGGAPTSTKDRVRLYTGDTDSTDQLLQDEEIALILADEGNLFLASAVACEAIAARFARKADYTVGKQVQETASQKQAHYLALALALRGKAARRGAAPLAGGLSLAQKETARQDPDAVQPPFVTGMESEPGTESAVPDRWPPSPF